MNVLKLEKADKEQVIYSYQPEGIGDLGEISFSFASNRAHVLKKAQQDTQNSRYANKAMQKISDFILHKNLPLEYIRRHGIKSQKDTHYTKNNTYSEVVWQ
ncbi:MAG: hypothetical protein RSC58_05745 [Ruthenibacterium sp.]